MKTIESENLQEMLTHSIYAGVKKILDEREEVNFVNKNQEIVRTLLKNYITLKEFAEKVKIKTQG